MADAVDQYRYDREPTTKGKPAEPLLSWRSGALVHFAVSNTEVRMTTKLADKATVFLPFNCGDGGAARNPVNPRGHRTAYLWEEVWARESWLEILGRYVVTQRDESMRAVGLIFPRYHQLDATRKLQAAVLHDGVGGRYLVQHSAGSGKTNSIAWIAHFLTELHDAKQQRVFDDIVVVSDRKVIDVLLQAALFDFQRTAGVVATIKGEGGRKGAELADAFSAGKKIFVCTIQPFPPGLQAVRELAAAQGKRFAVIADEADSSQTGESAAQLKAVLTPEEIDALGDGGEVRTDDLLTAGMTARADDRDITFVAFTATLKWKTLELFGTRPDPTRKPAPDNMPVPFHVYSMRQAIEERFILDVLQNYTPYSLAFKLAHDGKQMSEAGGGAEPRHEERHGLGAAPPLQHRAEGADRRRARQAVRRAAARLDSEGRWSSWRAEWRRCGGSFAIERYIKERRYSIGTPVAFSGEVHEPESGPEPFTEHSKALNPMLKGRDIREAFKQDMYQILLVANKFQTGFDQPLRCGRYVDKRLAGVQAVQRLSRLNRAYPGKDTTYVVEFVNNADAVLDAFRMYYETATSSATTDPNLVLNLRAKLDAVGYYDHFEVDRVVWADLTATKQGDLVAALEPVVDRLKKRYKAALSALKEAAQADDTKAQDALPVRSSSCW